MSGMASQMSNMVLVLGLVQVAKYLNLEDSHRAHLVLTAFAVANASILLGSLYLRSVIQRKNDTTPLKHKEAPSLAQPNGREVETTVRDYDLAEADKQIKGAVITVAMLGFMHYQWGFIQPLFLQTILPVKTFVTSNLVRIHLFNQPAEGALQRPWKVENPLEKLTQGLEAPTAETSAAAPKFEELVSSEEDDSDSEASSSDDEASSSGEQVSDAEPEPKKDK
ncbi:phosphate transporter (Pho88) [Tieghemiomyces parasiticus]|uniref:Phosphate transporter (Pho88) n=1 Tax=Tieghemiomyces parasiticus TaxID=78921 RepID=A0A9W8E1P5_9FUNG|nr:phosphate transporter (Pho88) [Tieghemiomyces parasiticus]